MARRPYSGKLVSPFGPRKSPGGIGSTNHLGEDGIGGPNVAPEAGVLTEWRRVGGWGNMAVIVGESGAVHCLAHNADRGQLAALGPVYEGQPIGVQGMTGTATGVHVHWEVRLKGVPVNPSAWLAEQHAFAALTKTSIEKEWNEMSKIYARPYDNSSPVKSNGGKSRIWAGDNREINGVLYSGVWEIDGANTRRLTMSEWAVLQQAYKAVDWPVPLATDINGNAVEQIAYVKQIK